MRLPRHYGQQGEKKKLNFKYISAFNIKGRFDCTHMHRPVGQKQKTSRHKVGH